MKIMDIQIVQMKDCIWVSNICICCNKDVNRND